VLEDEQLITAVYDALARRHPKSRTRGRKGTPADVVLRLLLLKHIRNWSYQVLERESPDQSRVPRFHSCGRSQGTGCQDYGTLGIGIRPGGGRKIHCRVVELAKENHIVKGRKMRLDTTVVETNIHYPTDSNLLGDGVRVLIRRDEADRQR